MPIKPIALLLVALLAQPSLAGWISEIQPTPRVEHNLARQTTVTFPPLVELSGLDGLDWVDLVILDASTSQSRRGRILQVIPIGPGPNVRVATGGAWPFSDPVTAPTHNDAGFSILNENITLNLEGPKTLILFADSTDLIANSGHISQYFDQIDAEILDIVTYGPAGKAVAFDNERVIVADSSDVITRPMMTEASPLKGFYLVGEPTPNGMLSGTSPGFPLNPGLMNLTSPTLSTPEPHTATLIALVWLSCICRMGGRRRK